MNRIEVHSQISWLWAGVFLAKVSQTVSVSVPKPAAFGTYDMVEISFSVQKSCLNVSKPSGSLVASYHGYVVKKPKR